jgi:phage recombination protein Bet
MNAVVQQEKKLPSLLEQISERNITPAQWHTLANSLYPGARAASVLLVIDYCRARKLDPLKKPCHIVPMKVKDQASGNWEWRDIVMPGIYEQRMTAHRTNEYRGHSAPEYGPESDFLGVKAPEFCAMTFFRRAGDNHVAEFPVRVYFRECAGTTEKGTKVNDRWSRAPIQMLTKCCEAAGLREAFPDELGGEMVEEEASGLTLEAEPAAATRAPADPDEMNAQLGINDEQP